MEKTSKRDMNDIQYKKLERLLEEHYKKTKEVSEKIIEELKISSEDYGEVIEKLKRFEKSTMFQYRAKWWYEDLFNITMKTLEKEMNDLPLTSRSK